MTDAGLRHTTVALLAATFAAAACSRREREPRADTPAVDPVVSSARAGDSALRAAAAAQDSLLALGDTRAAAGVSADGAGALAPTAAELAVLRRELAMPIAGVDPATLTDSFDEARGGGTRTHQALDVLAPRGTPVLSAAGGRVLRLYQSRDGGNMVYAADSSGRFVLMYAHLDGYAPGLADGQPLRRGQTIGSVGTTGNAPPTVPHLHFAIARVADVARWWTGTPVNPLPLLR
jgi:murein DD-endopeptidase MepM/ murein hydrolase activator NlpD